MVGACGKGLSSGHKPQGGAREGQREQRGALPEAYWPLCFTSVFLEEAWQKDSLCLVFGFC